jgi:predicted alpha/beta superfamily hydrolase
VALPNGYAESDRAYPVLWVTDNLLEAALTSVGAAQLILASVGHRTLAEFGERRGYEFMPPGDDLLPPGIRGEYLRQAFVSSPSSSSLRAGGAQPFLDFLVDNVRPALAADYRLSGDHGLTGFSGGGMFVVYALLSRPEAFRGYICGSPGLYNCEETIFAIEERYAAEHDDLPAHVFFGAGDGEILQPGIAAFGCVSSMARMAEVLSLRGYPSLRLEAKIFPGEDHATAYPPILSWGIRSLWPADRQ